MVIWKEKAVRRLRRGVSVRGRREVRKDSIGRLGGGKGRRKWCNYILIEKFKNNKMEEVGRYLFS